MKTPNSSKQKAQLIWATALILMGVAVIFRIPQVVPKLAEMGQSATTIGFVRICFYVIAFLLVGGGIKKVMNHFKMDENEIAHHRNENHDV